MNSIPLVAAKDVNKSIEMIIYTMEGKRYGS